MTSQNKLPRTGSSQSSMDGSDFDDSPPNSSIHRCRLLLLQLLLLLLVTSCHVPDGQDAAGLGQVGLLLDATDPLLENGRDLGRGGLCVGV